MKVSVFWDVTPCRLVNYRRFGRAHCLHLPGPVHPYSSDKGTAVLRNGGRYSPVGTAQHSRTTESYRCEYLECHIRLHLSSYDVLRILKFWWRRYSTRSSQTDSRVGNSNTPTFRRYLSFLKVEAKSVSETLMYSNYVMRLSAWEDFTAYNVLVHIRCSLHYINFDAQSKLDLQYTPTVVTVQQTHTNHFTQDDHYECFNAASKIPATGVLISPLPDLLPDVFCFMVRIFRLMLILLYIHK
jgi:hypothetical protein